MNTLLNKKILVVEIVEDEESMLRPMTDVLTAEGFNVLQARDGEEGLKKALDEKPDLILLDILMPRMDGLAMLQKLREDSWGKTAKVIVLSNLSDMDKVSKALEGGTYDYLMKTDWQISKVVEKIKKALGVS